MKLIIKCMILVIGGLMIVGAWMYFTLPLESVPPAILLPVNMNLTTRDFTVNNWDKSISDLMKPNNTIDVGQQSSLTSHQDEQNTTDKWQKTQQERRQNLQKACEGLSNSSMTLEYLFHNKKMLRHLLVDHTYGAIYCYIPKISCSNWKRIWLQMKNISFTPSQVHLKADKSAINEDNLEKEDFVRIMQTYKKFLIIRDPIERLISAYQNKFVISLKVNDFFWGRSQDMMRHYRNWSGISNETDVVIFKEFVQFIIDSVIQGKDLNEHWKTYEGLCHPCTISYDYIGRYESLTEDSNQILQELRVPSNLRFPKYKPRGTASLVQHYLDTLHPQQKEELYRVYKRDSLLFQY